MAISERLPSSARETHSSYQEQSGPLGASRSQRVVCPRACGIGCASLRLLFVPGRGHPIAFPKRHGEPPNLPNRIPALLGMSSVARIPKPRGKSRRDLPAAPVPVAVGFRSLGERLFEREEGVAEKQGDGHGADAVGDGREGRGNPQLPISPEDVTSNRGFAAAASASWPRNLHRNG
jgi:hypothetical protein